MVSNRELVGIVAETELLDYEHPEEQISAGRLHLMRPVIHYYQHAWFIAADEQYELNAGPGNDEKELYKGCITVQE